MEFLDRWFQITVLKDEAEVFKSFKTLYLYGFGVLLGSLLFFLFSSIRSVQLPFLIIGAMLQINAVLMFLYAGVVKIAWELSIKIDSAGSPKADEA